MVHNLIVKAFMTLGSMTLFLGGEGAHHGDTARGLGHSIQQGDWCAVLGSGTCALYTARGLGNCTQHGDWETGNRTMLVDLCTQTAR